jgi:Glucose / Sorbosone dehydrogenase
VCNGDVGRLAPGLWAAAAITVIAGCGGCGGDGSDSDGEDFRLAVEATVELGSRTEPVALAPLPDGGLLVGERLTGAIRRISAEGDLSEPIIQVDVQAGPTDQRGLLGLAVAGDRTYGAWTRAADGHIVVADLTDGLERLVWEGPASSDLANGGHLALLPDGRLVIGIGDLEDPDRAADPDAPNGKLLALDPTGSPDQDPAPLSEGWNNPFAFVVTHDGAIWVADNAPGDDPETLGRGDRASATTNLPGRRAPAALVEIDPDHLGLCGYLDGELRIVGLNDGHPRLDGTVATGCRTGAVSLSDGRVAVSDGERVRILARR